jgi:beta-glucosidase
MGRRFSVHALVVAALASWLVVAWPAAAAKQSHRDRSIERRVDSLLQRMTLEEKLNQLTLLSDGQMKDNPGEARKPVGAVFSETDPKQD